jgi:hypothetical protein
MDTKGKILSKVKQMD